MADFLIEGEVGIDLPGKDGAGLLQRPDGGKQHRGGGLVVHKAGFQIAARQRKTGLQGDHVPGLDAQGPGIGGGLHRLVQHYADIGAEVRRGLAQLLLGDVDRIGCAAHGTGIDPAVPGVDPDVLGHAVEGVQAAHRADVQSPVGVHPAHHEPDIVQMDRHRQGAALSAQLGDHAALVQRPEGDLQLLQQPADQLLDLLVLAGGAVDGQQALKHLQAIGGIKLRDLFKHEQGLSFSRLPTKTIESSIGFAIR